MDRYEISLWEDYPDTTGQGIPFLNERKLCVIGSNTMLSRARALEPKLVTNVNGTHTFTFKMYYKYIDELTGKDIVNPFSALLINERKVKVYWKDKWYDLLIKGMNEDSVNHTITYTCKDLFITELSKNGYNLEFTADLQNNTGTASELVEKVLTGSGWQFDKDNSTVIIQKTEEPVYETTVVTQNFSATRQSPNGDELQTIPAGAELLVFYSQLLNFDSIDYTNLTIQFLYSNEYITDENDMLVLNGDCFTIDCQARKVSGIIQFKLNNGNIFTIDTINGVSTRYRAERLIKSQITKYDELFDRYVNVYKDENDNEVWGYSKTEFSDPLTVINLIANPNEFTSLDGWAGKVSTFGVYPKFGSSTPINAYKGKSYLKVNTGWVYNNGLTANQSFLKPTKGDIKDGDTFGFHVGDKYIFRVKHKNDGDPSETAYLYDGTIIPHIKKYSSEIIEEDIQSGSGNENMPGAPESDEPELIPPDEDLPEEIYIDSSVTAIEQAIPEEDYFTSEHIQSHAEDYYWDEYVLTCVKSCSANDIQTLGILLEVTKNQWIEDIEFFKEEYGVTNYGETELKRMEPGQISLQGVSKIIYRYYNADHDGVTSAEDVQFLYEGEYEQLQFEPVTNNYEKIATIEARNSNRFNILQSIAESFECWVRFTINHDETGRMTFDEEGLPEKYITLVEYVGTDLGWSFEYGIDLKSIKRKVVSDNIVTKVIVLPNENEFGKNGFCTIARSDLNYSKENFILNLDYYINQGLLDQRTVDRDLYSTSDNFIGYYYNLHKLNSEYDEITNILTQKNMEYTKQCSQLAVLIGRQKALVQQIKNCMSDVMTLACVDDWLDAGAYVRSHADNTKVQSLMNAYVQSKNEYQRVTDQVESLEKAVNKLKVYIATQLGRQNIIANRVEELHIKFFQKYARYLQEGTWQDGNYIDDDKYYLDAVDVAYTSSRPQIQYTIDVMRLSALTGYAAKIFDVGDICYIQDRDYFGYMKDGITPYKLRIVISEITSYFDQPEKDQIKVQNYKTQFDDLFQRITATTQSLQYAQGGYEKAASVINHDKTLSFDMLQDTFDYNSNLVLNASNQRVTWNETGVTVTDDTNAALQVKLMAGGLFISNDGGATWKNAVRGDGISTDVLTAGRINTSEIYVYDGNHPSFRWDSAGIDAYYYDSLTSSPTFSKYVRFDRFGIYGYDGSSDFVPSTEDAIWASNSGVKFGLTWRGFFLRGSNSGAELQIQDDGTDIVFKMLNKIGNNSLEISTDNDIVLKTLKTGSSTELVDRVQIGRLNPNSNNTEYGIWVRDGNGDNIFNVSSNGVNAIGGWTLTKDSFYHNGTYGTIGLFSSGRNWTIANPNTDTITIGHPDIPDPEPGETSNNGRLATGDTHDYYIIAGNKFGVTIDGEVYAAGGRIGGWHINATSLYSEGSNIITNLPTVLTGNGYVQPKSYGDTVENITTNVNNIETTRYTVNNYQSGFLYVTANRDVNGYNISAHPVVVVVTDNNNHLLQSFTSDATTLTRYEINLHANAYYLYINSKNTTTGPTLESKTDETTYNVISSDIVTKKNYIQPVDLTNNTVQVLTNVSGAKYNKYNVSAYGNKIIYITSTRSYYETLPILAIVTDTIQDNGSTVEVVVQVSEISLESIENTPLTLVSSAKYLYLNYTSNPAVGPSTSRTVTMSNDGSLSCSYSGGNLWKIDDQGNAYFEMINAVGGYIAGWHIDNDKIWNDNGTTLSSSGNAVYNVNKYTIVTNSLAASYGNIGGWNMNPYGFSNGSNGLYNDGTIKLNGTTMKAMAGGIVINGSLQLGNSNLTGALVAYGNVVSILGGVHRSLPIVYEDFEETAIWADGATNTSRKDYIDWLHSNWGDTTPSEVREEGQEDARPRDVIIRINDATGQPFVPTYQQSRLALYIPVRAITNVDTYQYDGDLYVDARPAMEQVYVHGLNYDSNTGWSFNYTTEKLTTGIKASAAYTRGTAGSEEAVPVDSKTASIELDISSIMPSSLSYTKDENNNIIWDQVNVSNSSRVIKTLTLTQTLSVNGQSMTKSGYAWGYYYGKTDGANSATISAVSVSAASTPTKIEGVWTSTASVIATLTATKGDGTTRSDNITFDNRTINVDAPYTKGSDDCWSGLTWDYSTTSDTKVSNVVIKRNNTQTKTYTITIQDPVITLNGRNKYNISVLVKNDNGDTLVTSTGQTNTTAYDNGYYDASINTITPAIYDSTITYDYTPLVTQAQASYEGGEMVGRLQINLKDSQTIKELKVRINALDAYNAGKTDGASNLWSNTTLNIDRVAAGSINNTATIRATATATGYTQKQKDYEFSLLKGTSGTGYDSTNHIYSILVNAIHNENNSDTTIAQYLVTTGTEAYTAGWDSGAATAKATGVTIGETGTASWNSEDQAYYANASVTATSAGVNASGNDVTGTPWVRNSFPINVTTPYTDGKGAGKTELWSATSVSISGPHTPDITDSTSATITATASATGQTSKTATYGINLTQTSSYSGHKYTVTNQITHGNDVLASRTYESGTEAYSDGELDGYSNATIKSVSGTSYIASPDYTVSGIISTSNLHKSSKTLYATIKAKQNDDVEKSITLAVDASDVYDDGFNFVTIPSNNDNNLWITRSLTNGVMDVPSKNQNNEYEINIDIGGKASNNATGSRQKAKMYAHDVYALGLAEGGSEGIETGKTIEWNSVGATLTGDYKYPNGDRSIGLISSTLSDGTNTKPSGTYEVKLVKTTNGTGYDSSHHEYSVTYQIQNIVDPTVTPIATLTYNSGTDAYDEGWDYGASTAVPYSINTDVNNPITVTTPALAADNKWKSTATIQVKAKGINHNNADVININWTSFSNTVIVVDNAVAKGQALRTATSATYQTTTMGGEVVVDWGKINVNSSGDNNTVYGLNLTYSKYVSGSLVTKTGYEWGYEAGQAAATLNLYTLPTITENDTYPVPSGYDGFAGPITVNVPGGGGGYDTYLVGRNFNQNITLNGNDYTIPINLYGKASGSSSYSDITNSLTPTYLIVAKSALPGGGGGGSTTINLYWLKVHSISGTSARLSFADFYGNEIYGPAWYAIDDGWQVFKNAQ